ncbi:MAG: sigma-54-dependent Fis family transcriptional regulator [Candidatus Sumerlaeia bacterium]|nr:sigma-54-dependent Fis family transcriptional regulator [Candidatus Sumerlaeia bacterium]
MTRILIIEDDPSFGQRLARNLALDGFETEHAEGGTQGLNALTEKKFDAILCDIKMPGIGGLELLTRIRTGQQSGIDPQIPMIMLTSMTSVEVAVDAMRRGASDYLTKEAGRAEIAVRLRRAIERRDLTEENTRLRESLARHDEFSEMVGNSKELESIKAEIEQVAPTDATVMLLGETGVGKELVARAIHRSSGRKGPFIDINGAMLPDDTSFQSELFGHERGAFTDAHQMKKGKMELADGGTLFIDEVGEVSLAVQAKLLRVLETMTFTRLGGTKPIHVDVRVVVATNRDLLDRAQSGGFRSDLYYRLNVFPVNILPLRKRREDIPILTLHFIRRFAEKYGRPVPMLEQGAMQKLMNYEWPGNIRELRNICERLVIRVKGSDTLTSEDVAACGLHTQSTAGQVVNIPEEGIDLDEVEKMLVVEALNRADWNQTEASRLLNISVDRMNNRVKKWNLKHENWRVNKKG